LIIFKKDQDIFSSTAYYLINPVNTKGVMGKGLALEMKQRFPDNFKFYKSFCSSSNPKGGDLLFYYPKVEDYLKGDRCIINFCTKEDWRKPSKIDWIEKGLAQLVVDIINIFPNNEYPSPLLAVPLIECGQGGLNREKVIEVIRDKFKDCLFDIEVYI